MDEHARNCGVLESYGFVLMICLWVVSIVFCMHANSTEHLFDQEYQKAAKAHHKRVAQDVRDPSVPIIIIIMSVYVFLLIYIFYIRRVV